MNHEGTPVLFRFESHQKGFDRDGNLGVFVSSFKMKVKQNPYQGVPQEKYEDRARIWSPVDSKMHTCSLLGVTSLDSKRLEIDSIVILDWKAIVMVMPVDLSIVMNHGEILRDVEDRARLTHYVDIPSSAWPKNMDKSLPHLKPQKCWISRHDIDPKGYFHGVVYSRSGSSLHLERDYRLKLFREGSWLEYDPALKEQPWQIQSREIVTRMMEHYEDYKKAIYNATKTKTFVF